MKMNKLAAGALALALGLGAVAPAVAAESKKEVAQYTGAQHFLTEYKAELKKVNKLYADYLAAKEDEAAKLKVLNEKKAALELAIKNFEDYVGRKEIVKKVVEITEEGKTEEKKFEERVFEVVREDRDYHVVLAREAYNKVLELTSDGEDKLGTLDSIIATPDYVAPRDLTLKEETEEHKLALSEALDTLENEANYLYKAPLKQAKIMELAKKVRVAVLERNIAQTEYNEAVKKTAAAWDAYVDLREKLVLLAEDYNVVVQIGNDGIQVVNKDDAHVKPIGEKKSKEEVIKELKAAKERALRTIEAVRLLEELTPQKIADVKDQLNKLVAEQKALIEKADKYLAANKVAFIATAYAEEEEMSAEEITDALNSKSDKIEELIKDKPEDKVEEEKPEEKPEEKEEDKKEEKKEEKKPAKKAGNNARTGIAGVAGVAGILAAASVAYAASKRD